MLKNLLQSVKDWADARFLKLTGGTLTGALTLENGNLLMDMGAVDRDGAISSDTLANRIIFRDKDNERIGELRVTQHADGRMELLHGVVNEKTDGSETSNWFNMLISKDGVATYSVSSPANFRTAISAAASSHTHSYLPLSGGTMTGALHLNFTSPYIRLKASNVNAALANNNISSGSVWPALYITDSADRTIMRIESVVNSNGNIGSYWYVNNYNTSGTGLGLKGIAMTMNKSGTLTYSVADNANFRSAIAAANKPAQLYNNTSGSNGTITLSASAANYNHMRIFFRIDNGASYVDSADVYSPNGKIATLTTAFTGNDNATQTWMKTRAVSISGTSISTYAARYANTNTTYYSEYGHDNYIWIIRVEAWND